MMTLLLCIGTKAKLVVDIPGLCEHIMDDAHAIMRVMQVMLRDN